MGILVLAFLAALPGASSTIYKCVSSAGAISYSAKPCAGSQRGAEVKPRTDTAVVDRALPPPTLGAAAGKVDPNAPPTRSRPPPIEDRCRKELFGVQRFYENEFSRLRGSIKSETAMLQENSTNLYAAQESKVGPAWSIKLASERKDIEARLASATIEEQGLYQRESDEYRNIGARCKPGAPASAPAK